MLIKTDSIERFLALIQTSEMLDIESYNKKFKFALFSQIGKLFGVESHVLTPAETKKLFPLLNVDDMYGSLYSPGDGGVDPSSYCGALTKVATNLGAVVKEECPVLGKYWTDSTIIAQGMVIAGCMRIPNSTLTLTTLRFRY